MTRCIRAYIAQSPTSVGEECALSEDEAVHLSRVLRLQTGATIECLDGQGGCFQAECRYIDPRCKFVYYPSIGLCLSSQKFWPWLSKGSKWDELIRPVTELGVSRLSLVSKRTEGEFLI